VSRALKIRIAVFVALILHVVVVVALIRSAMPFSERTLLKWKHRDTGTKVWLLDDHSFDNTLQLHVERNGRRQMGYVIDKSSYGTLRFALYGKRLLALNDSYIFAAYDLESNQILYYWQLPFTIYEGQGEIVASHREPEGAVMRSGFPRTRESEAATSRPGGSSVDWSRARRSRASLQPTIAGIAWTLECRSGLLRRQASCRPYALHSRLHAASASSHAGATTDSCGQTAGSPPPPPTIAARRDA